MSSYSTSIQGDANVRAPRWGVSPWAIFATAWRDRSLIYQLAKREVESRYRGSMLGIVWSLLVPLFMLGVYTLVFGGFFHNTWPIPPGGRGSFFLILFMGLILLNFFSECVSRAPTLLMSNVSYIKRVVFPVETLAFVLALSAMFDLIVSIVVLISIFVVMLGLPTWQVIMLPVVVAPFLLLTLGMIWFISSLGVYLRDLRQIIGVILTALPFLCPLFYPFEAFGRFGSAFKQLIFLNPLTVPVVQSRQVLFFNQVPSWKLWLAYTVASYLFAYAGLVWFKYSQKGFADVV
ncbi:MAG TPA: ABC transporter permease [Tepidisphaeraceae bacterium]|jgi:lipopolysaccharide transport system permease protein